MITYDFELNHKELYYFIWYKIQLAYLNTSSKTRMASENVETDRQRN